MATSVEFIQYVSEQLQPAGVVAIRKMFGEYAVYLNGKVIALVCDNQFFVKKTPGAEALFPGLPEGAPYPGAKPHFLIEDLDNASFLKALLQTTEQNLPAPAKKRVI